MSQPLVHAIRWRLAGGEIIGSRERQEDAQLHFESPERLLLAIADGLGGHADGNIASEIAVQSALRVLRGHLLMGQIPDRDLFVESFVEAHRSVLRIP